MIFFPSLVDFPFHDGGASQRSSARRSKSVSRIRSASDFTDRWAAFIRTRFTTHDEVARAFGCTERTAIHWLNGSHAPRGHHVGHAVVRYGFLLND